MIKKPSKRLITVLTAILITALLCIPSLSAILYYTRPMEDASYDLSLLPEDGKEFTDDKEWGVYKDVDGMKTELASDGNGGYTGLDYAGQTFYFSRELSEELDSPTLQIGVVNQNITIFLDDAVIYSDCPELDNRIGYLTLPMSDYERMEPTTVSLPSDYQGKTLTIAQSSSAYSEKQSEEADTVWPCEVKLYCGYAYESSLIASASDTMLHAVLLFALILLLLGAFVWNASLGSFLPVLPVLTLAVLFFMCSILAKADFFYRYLGMISPDPVWLFFHLSVGTLPIFLTLYTKSKKIRLFLCALIVMQWSSIILYVSASLGWLIPYGDTYVFLTGLPQLTGFLILSAILVSSFFIRKNKQPFWIRFNKMSILIIAGYLAVLLVSFLLHSNYTSGVFSRLSAECRIFLPNFFLKLLWYLNLLSTIISVLLDLIEKATERRIEASMLKVRNELAVSSYENLKYQTEEIMMIQHDITKHYKVLREMTQDTPEKIGSYLDDLLGEIQAQRHVITTKNKVLDILLNGEINVAASRGIPVTFLRCDAPVKLALNDTELCCLIMNILDNAIHAASQPGTPTPYIELDLHCKENHFVFTCKNTFIPKYTYEKEQKKTVPEHGYGLKIIHNIMERFGAMYSILEDGNTYQITLILPL